MAMAKPKIKVVARLPVGTDQTVKGPGAPRRIMIKPGEALNTHPPSPGKDER